MANRQPHLDVIKSDGKTAPFSSSKVRKSLLRSGAAPETVEMILDELYKEVYPGMPTSAIYEIVSRLLKKHSYTVAGKYHLKQAIFELGPSGFPFEQYVAELFRHTGFTASTNSLMDGHCVRHEVDILATRERTAYIIECKYHQLQGTHCDVKIPLYVQSRFKDIALKWNEKGTYQCSGWIVTNTRFSTDAAQYAHCMGLKTMSWDFPAGKDLKDVIDQSGLYPVTCLTTLSYHEKYQLLNNGIILCKTLNENPDRMAQAGINGIHKSIVLEESHQLCQRIKVNEWI